VLPVVVKAAVVAMIWHFPLDRERHAQLQSEIGQRGR
jgi:Na+/melibiose symporter-like transporter